MRNSFIPLLIIGLLFYASVSLVMMNHTYGQGHGDCPFKTTGVVDCIQVQNPLDFMIAHLNALAKFSLAAPVESFMVSLVLLLILAFSTFVDFNKKFESITPQAAFIRSHIRESFISPNRIIFNYWFALHENSPATL